MQAPCRFTVLHLTNAFSPLLHHRLTGTSLSLAVCAFCPVLRRARIDTLSKARYGTLLKQLGGWGWMQDMLQVRHGDSFTCR